MNAAEWETLVYVGVMFGTALTLLLVLATVMSIKHGQSFDSETFGMMLIFAGVFTIASLLLNGVTSAVVPMITDVKSGPPDAAYWKSIEESDYSPLDDRDHKWLDDRDYKREPLVGSTYAPTE